MTVARTERSRSHHTGWASCRGGSHPQTSTTNEREVVANAAYSGAAQVTVRLENSGEFLIEAVGPEREATGEVRTTTTSGRDDGCGGAQPGRAETASREWRGGYLSAGISGTADADADTLQGSRTKVEKSRDGRSITTHIYEWSLRR